MLCFTLEVWGFTSDWHPFFQIPNSSPEWQQFLLIIVYSTKIMKQNKNVVETWFLVGKKNPTAFAKNLWKVYV